MPHAYTFTPDAARSLVLLAASATAWNQTWHVPTAAAPPTGRAFIHQAAHALGVKPKYRILRRPLIRLAGWFSGDIRASYEMLYQNDAPYLFDSSKFTAAFGVEPTSYEDGIRRTARAYRSPRS